MKNNLIHRFTITYEAVINPNGEIISTKIIDKSDLIISKPEEPIIILGDNKLIFNATVISMMNLSCGDKVDVKYDLDGVPIIGTDGAFGVGGGNKLTKSNTVSFKGDKRKELIKFGDKFTIVPHASTKGLFYMTSLNKEEIKNGDEKINIEDVDFDDLLDELIDNEDTTEVNSNFFKL